MYVCVCGGSIWIFTRGLGSPLLVCISIDLHPLCVACIRLFRYVTAAVVAARERKAAKPPRSTAHAAPSPIPTDAHVSDEAQDAWETPQWVKEHAGVGVVTSSARQQRRRRSGKMTGGRANPMQGAEKYVVKSANQVTTCDVVCATKRGKLYALLLTGRK